tara:strand:+ start:241 stop:945 length:705 start_codon:yes stop_codon:yes gene_type:complete
MINLRIKKIFNRLKAILSIGQNYYQGELYEYFDNLFLQLEKKEITPDEAKNKVNKLFNNNKEFNLHFNKWTKNNRSNFSSIGQMIRPFRRIRFGIIYINKDEYEPVHYHGGFSSFQIVLKGDCILDEFDTFELSKKSIKYKSHKRIHIKENDVMLNYSNYRDMHGFGAKNGSVYILSVAKYYGFLGKFKFDFIKPEVNKRVYVDIKNQKAIKEEIFESPLIDKNEAYAKYINLE